jgi:hypothetical protein
MDLSKHRKYRTRVLIVKSYGFIQNMDEPCVYRKTDRNNVSFLVLYVDYILLIGNDIGTLSPINVYLSSQFSMREIGEDNYILGINLLKDRK